MSFTYWHNPRCSKSRHALELIQENGVDPKIRHYLSDAPSETEIRAVCDLLGGPVINIVRTGEKVFSGLGLSAKSDEAVLIAAMAAHPVLIERPILIAADKAAVGRPPENVLKIL